VPFGNPIIGGQSKLIREAIQSPNYLPGVQGWSINRDGTSEFAGGSFRGAVVVVDGNGNTLGGIDVNGNLTGPNGYFSEDVYIDGLAIDGSASSSPNIPRVPGATVGGGIIDSLPYGLVSYGPFVLSNGAVVATTGFQGIVSNSFQAELGRMYILELTDMWIAGNATGGYHEIDVCWNLPASNGDQSAVSPSIGSTANWVDLHPTINTYHKCYSKFGPFTCTPGGDIPFSGLVQFILQMRCSTSTVTYQQPSGARSIQAFANVYDIGPIIGATSGFLSNKTSGSQAPTQNYTRTYTCTDSGTYDQGGSRVSSFANEMNVGYNQGTGGSYGTQQSMAIFPNMTGDLAGASISGMSVTIHNHHWWYNAGGTVQIGFHGNTSMPGSFNIGAWPNITGTMTGGQTSTFAIPSSAYASFISGAYRGINLHAPNSNATYYGRFDGAGYSYPPKITVTYTK
jgi:hypothetical protein